MEEGQEAAAPVDILSVPDGQDKNLLTPLGKYDPVDADPEPELVLSPPKGFDLRGWELAG